MMLDEAELMKRNLGLARTWLHKVVAHPQLIRELPDNAYLFDLPHDDPDLLTANLQMATELALQMEDNGHEKRPIVLLPQ
jgi:hypothetical protein